MSETQTTHDAPTGSRSGDWDEETVAAAERLLEAFPEDDELATLCESIVHSDSAGDSREAN